MSTSGGSGGGATLTAVHMSAAANVDGNVATYLNLYDTQASIPDSNAFTAAATSTPTIVAPLSNVLDSPSSSVTNVDTTDSSFLVEATITVSNLAATEVLLISASATAAAGGPHDNAIIDWTTADTTVVAGTDLTWDGTSVVTSTAGGVFVVLMVLGSGYL